jgi:hypothetical protein
VKSAIFGLVYQMVLFMRPPAALELPRMADDSSASDE